MEVKINQVVLHLLDPGASEPVLSDRAMDMDADLYEYYTATLERAFASDEVKNCRFLPDSAFAAEMAQNQDFIDLSRRIAGVIFEQAMENVMPQLEVKARRVGGATYQVPMEVRPERRQTLGLRWMTNYSRLRSEKTMKERLAGEILDAVNGAGGAAKKRDDTHKMAEANRAFAHYRW